MRDAPPDGSLPGTETMRDLTFPILAAALALTAACSSGVVSSGTGGNTSTSTGSGGDAPTSSSSSSGSGGGVTCATPPAPQTFELGTGEKCFERVTAGQELPVLQGPQGGYHLWLAVGCADCGLQLIAQYGIKDPATHDWIAGTAANQAVFPITTPGWAQLAGFTDFLPGVIWDPMSSLPKGTHVLLYAAVLDMNSAVKHEAEVEVVLGDIMPWAGPPCDAGPNCGTPGGLPCCTDGTFGDAGP